MKGTLRLLSIVGLVVFNIHSVFQPCCLAESLNRCLAASGDVVVPRVESPPKIDGILNDKCWEEAAVISDFSVAESIQSPRKDIVARVFFDDIAIYFGFTCQEPNPLQIKADSKIDSEDVWKDDCIEIFLRTTERSADFDQFIVNTLSSRQTVRRREGAREPGWKPTWQAKAKVAKTAWTLEVKVPFKTLQISVPARGSAIQMKLGREDYAGRMRQLVTWPAGTRYGGADNYGMVYFESDNILRNADMTELREGVPVHWDFSEGAVDRFSVVKDDGKEAIYFASPGTYCAASQELALQPNSVYSLSVRTRGERIEFRLRSAAGETLKRLTTKPTDTYQKYELTFWTPADGSGLLAWGSTKDTVPGDVYIRDLRIAKAAGVESFGPRIPVEADSGLPLVVTKIRVADVRALKGFLGTVIDGTTESRDWAGNFYEYNRPGGGIGVHYAYHNNDGLHIILEDAEDVDALLIRGGAACKLYADCPHYDSPEGGRLLAKFLGKTRRTRALFKKRVQSRRFSFFELNDGYMADVSFFRLREGRAEFPIVWVVGSKGPSVVPAGRWLIQRFKKQGVKTFVIGPKADVSGLAGQGGGPIRAEAKEFFHLMSEPFEKETSIVAVGLDAVVKAARPLRGVPFTFRVQDPFNPRAELAGADFELSKSGRLRVIMDFPDQVVPAGKGLWLTLGFDVPVVLEGPSGGPPHVEVYLVPRERALPQALAHRKLLMKTYFSALSEPRPWTGMTPSKPLEHILGRYEDRPEYVQQIKELQEAIEYCYNLAPEDPTVRQYYEWFYRTRIRPELPEPKIESVPDAPEWAVVARAAWLAAREVPRWWLENRMVPTGEFGSGLGDDTDMFQNYLDFPMLESDGVGGMLKDGARRLAALADERTLEAGVNRRTMDPLHAYEEGMNHEGLMVLWFYGDPVYVEWCMAAARTTEEALTTVTPDGRRHFKSQQLGAEDLRINRKTDIDGGAHFLMLEPSLMFAWYNRNPRTIRFLKEWGDTWLKFHKPGRYARQVEVATGKVVEASSDPLRAYGQASAHLLLAYVTGEPKYIRPFHEAASRGQAGRWASRYMVKAYNWGLLEPVKEKLPEIAKKVGGFPDYVVNGEKSPLIADLKRSIAEVQYFWQMYTSAEMFTDRIFMRDVTPQIGIAYTGGYATRNRFAPSYAVSWEGFGTDYAALVPLARPDGLKVLVYNFAEETKRGRMRVWALSHGRYRFTQGIDVDGDDQADEVERSEIVELLRGGAISLVLPPGKTSVIEITQKEALEPIYWRADLALSALEVKRQGDTVTGVVHNIGSKAARAVVALVDADGKVQARKDLGVLDAPLDLNPKRRSFELKGLPWPGRPAKSDGWAVIVDPEGVLDEIYEGNNRVAVPQ